MDCAEPLGSDPVDGKLLWCSHPDVFAAAQFIFRAMRKTQTENAYWQRIEAIIQHYQFRSVSAFSDYLGLNRPENLYQIKRGHNAISRELAETICGLFPEISQAWLLTGENEMLRDAKEPDGILQKIRHIPFYVDIPPELDGKIPDTILYCSAEIVGNADLATFYRGNALLPTYKSGAIVFLKKWDMKGEPVFGDVYYIRTVNFSKFRIIREGRDKRHFRLTTFSPDQYDDMQILRTDILCLYHVCGANIF